MRFKSKHSLQADRIAAGFLKLGLCRGDRIGIWSPNSTEWYLSMMAAARAGLISVFVVLISFRIYYLILFMGQVALNPAYQGREIAYCIKKVGIKAIIAPETHKTQNYYEILTKIVPEIPSAMNGRIESNEFNSLKSLIIDAKSKMP